MERKLDALAEEISADLAQLESAQRIELPEGFEDMARMWSEGGISARQAAKSLGINYKTFLNRSREYCVAV